MGFYEIGNGCGCDYEINKQKQTDNLILNIR